MDSGTAKKLLGHRIEYHTWWDKTRRSEVLVGVMQWSKDSTTWGLFSEMGWRDVSIAENAKDLGPEPGGRLRCRKGRRPKLPVFMVAQGIGPELWRGVSVMCPHCKKDFTVREEINVKIG